MKRQISLMMILMAMMLLLSSCTSVYQKAEMKMKDEAHSVFNPEALYLVPPEGLWVQNLVIRKTGEETGPIYLIPGTAVGYSEKLVK